MLCELPLGSGQPYRGWCLLALFSTVVPQQLPKGWNLAQPWSTSADPGHYQSPGALGALGALGGASSL